MNTSFGDTRSSVTGAWPPPPGFTPNFVDPPSIAWQVAPIRVAFSSAATFFVILRIYTRGVLIRTLGIDDAFVVISLIISWGFTTFGILAIPYGFGIDLWNLRVSDVIMFLKIDLGGQLSYFLATMFVKVSIILMYLRLNPDRTFRKIAYAIIAFDVTYCLLSCGISAFGCMPLQSSWNFTIPHKCVDKKAYFYAQANFNIVSDFATLLLPVRMCLKLQLPTKQKWMLVLLFAVGSFACIVSIVRLATLIPSLHSMNFTKFKVQVGAWATIELNTSIICACLTCLKPLLKRLFPSMMSSSSTRSPYNSTRPNISTTPSKKTTSFSDSMKHPFPTFPLRSLSIRRPSSDDDIEAEAIRTRIRGWSDSKPKTLPMGYTNEVTAREVNMSGLQANEQGQVPGVGGESESIRRILSSGSSLGDGGDGNGNDKGVDIQKGGVLKTVVYDVRYD